MKPVDQDSFYDPDKGTKGNCLTAAVASILELSLSEVPNFHESEEGFWFGFAKFLRERGFVFIEFHHNDPQLDCYYLAHGKSPRTDHSVVMRAGKLAHDPHPSRAGLVSEPQLVTILVPIDPSCHIVG